MDGVQVFEPRDAEFADRVPVNRREGREALLLVVAAVSQPLSRLIGFDIRNALVNLRSVRMVTLYSPRSTRPT